MFESIITFFKKFGKGDQKDSNSKDTAKERLHLVLMQDRANVSADFLEMMKQEIIDVIKKYIDVDEQEIDVRLTNKTNEDGTSGAPALYANIPIVSVKNENKIKSEITEKVKEANKKVEEANKNGKEDHLNEKKEDSVNSEKSANKEVKENQSEDTKKDDKSVKTQENVLKKGDIKESSVKQNKKQEKIEEKKIEEAEEDNNGEKSNLKKEAKKDENKKQSKKNTKVASKTK